MLKNFSLARVGEYNYIYIILYIIYVPKGVPISVPKGGDVMEKVHYSFNNAKPCMTLV